MNQSRHDVWVGLVVLIGAAALLFLAQRTSVFVSNSEHQVYILALDFSEDTK